MKKVLFGYFSLLVYFVFPLAGELQEIECSIKPLIKKRHHSSASHSHIHHHPRNRKVHTVPHIPAEASGSSTNWSGYAALTSLTSPAADSVTHVAGSWNVPTLSATPNNAYSSAWVGIDGFASSTVEQIGTEHDWRNGSQSNYAWFEMYPGGAYEILGFPVHNGDLISATVNYQGSNIFKLTLINHTRNVTYTVPTSYTQSSTAKRSSAEWIMEAPSSSSVLPLADYRTIRFSSCTATIHGITGPINSAHWVNEAITMVTQNGTVKSKPSVLTPSGEGFTVTWEHE